MRLTVARQRSSTDRTSRVTGISMYSGSRIDKVGLNASAGEQADGNTFTLGIPFAAVVSSGGRTALAVCSISRMTPKGGHPMFSLSEAVAMSATTIIEGRVMQLVPHSLVDGSAGWRGNSWGDQLVCECDCAT